MEARYLTQDDVIVSKKGKRFRVLSTTVRGKRIIVETDGGRLTFRLDQKVILD